MKWHFLLALLLSLFTGVACDDGDSAETTADGGGGEGEGEGEGQGEGEGEAASDTFIFTTLSIAEPEGAAGTLLGSILQISLDNKAVIIMMQVDGWDGDNSLTIRGGAGQQTAGAETEADFSDDSFDWLTSGECRNTETDETEPCSVAVGEVAGTQTDNTFVSSRTQLEIYSEDLAVIIPIKGIELSGTITDGVVAGAMNGAITATDAAATEFKLSPEAENTTALDAFFAQFNVEADAMVDDGTGNMVPGFAISGTFEAELITFSGN